MRRGRRFVARRLLFLECRGGGTLKAEALRVDQIFGLETVRDDSVIKALTRGSEGGGRDKRLELLTKGAAETI